MPRTQLTTRPSPALGRANKPLGREVAAAQRPAKLVVVLCLTLPVIAEAALAAVPALLTLLLSLVALLAIVRLARRPSRRRW